MQVTAADVKKLREETGAGIMDAKKALVEAKGNFDEAKKIIAKKGMAKADKKADRETGVTRVFAYVHFNGKAGSLVRLACETDFVANTDDFANLGKELAMQITSMRPETPEELLKQDYLRDSKKTIEALVKEVSAKTGENVKVLEFSNMG